MVRQYKASDIGEIQHWFRLRRMHPPAEENFPRIGYICPGAAFGGLYVADGNFVFPDAFVTNPEASKGAGAKGLDEVCETMLGTIKSLGNRQVIVYTHQPAIQRRAEEYGLTLVATDRRYVGKF